MTSADYCALILHSDPVYRLNIVAVPIKEHEMKDYSRNLITLYSNCGRMDWYQRDETVVHQRTFMPMLIHKDDEELFKTYGDEALEYALSQVGLTIWMKKGRFLARKGFTHVTAKDILNFGPWDFRLNGLRHWMIVLGGELKPALAEKEEVELKDEMLENLLTEYFDIENLMLPHEVEEKLLSITKTPMQKLEDICLLAETVRPEMSIKIEEVEELDDSSSFDAVLKEMEEPEPFIYVDKHGNSWGGTPDGYDPPEKYMGIEKKFGVPGKPKVPITKNKKTPEQVAEQQQLRNLRRFGQPQKNKLGFKKANVEQKEF